MIFIALFSFLIAEIPAEIDSEVTRAIQGYEKLIEKFPEIEDLKYNLGNIYANTGNLDLAKKEFQRALSTDDNELKAYSLYNMGNIEFQRDNYEESINLYREALKILPDDKDILHNYIISQKILKDSQGQESSDSSDGEQESSDSGQDSQGQESSDSLDGEQESSDSGQDSQGQESSDSSDGEQESSDSGQDSQGQEPSDSLDGEQESSDSGQDSQGQEPSDSLDGEQESSDSGIDQQNEEQNKSDTSDYKNNNLTQKEKRNLQEAEAILNTLKANQKNMKKNDIRVGLVMMWRKIGD